VTTEAWHLGEVIMTDAPIPSPADAQAAYWNSPAARAWAEQHERQDRALASLATVALDLAAPQPGEHVLDIGCGSGTTVLELAARVVPRGYVLGADIAEHSVARARERIAAAGLQHAEVIVPMSPPTPLSPATSIWRFRGSASCSSPTRSPRSRTCIAR
jgi:SAM-dependent methyltransferase